MSLIGATVEEVAAILKQNGVKQDTVENLEREL